MHDAMVKTIPEVQARTMHASKIMIMHEGGVKTKHEGLKVHEGMVETLREGQVKTNARGKG